MMLDPSELAGGKKIEVLIDRNFPPCDVPTRHSLDYSPGQFDVIFSVRGGVILPDIFV